MTKLKASNMGSHPLRRLLVDYPSEVANARYFQDDDAVVVIKDAMPEKDIHDFARFERCLNDPEGLKGPAIINRAFKGDV